MPINVYSFFSGVGLLDLGFENAGFNIEFVNEYDERFLQAYQYARRNYNSVPRYGYSHDDIRVFLSDQKWKASFPEYDDRRDSIVGFIGGPPCPDFSSAGNNAGEKGENGQLTVIYVKLIVKRQPDFFVFENVKGLYRTQKHRVFYERMKRKLYKAGYSLFDSIENALLYGTPQYRDRLFLIGFKRKTFGRRIRYGIGNNRIYSINQISTVKWPTIEPFAENGHLDMPNGIIEQLTVKYWFDRNHVLNHPNGNDTFGIRNIDRFATIPEGEIRGKSFKRLHRWRYSPTAAYGNNEVHLHPYMPRRISVAEALAIQSVPQWFELPHDYSLSAKFKMVGNGVPYLLAYGIAQELYEWLNGFKYGDR